MARVAVVGSGPAGVYSAAALLDDESVSVDVLDRSPSPFGLVRYGVAPDHLKIKSISSTLAKVLSDPRLRFLGNVEVGRDLTVAELHDHYDAVIFAVGAATRGRSLEVPGEQLAGSASGVDFVRWYSGHPDASPPVFGLSATSVVVVGAGNVALDVVRMLSRTADELSRTDVPQPVLEEFRRSAVREIHVLVRRGPDQTRFTTVELRELGVLSGADVRVDPDDIGPDVPAEAGRNVARRNVEVFREWSQRQPKGRHRTIHVHFWRQPTALLGDDRVSAVVVEGTRATDDGTVVGTGETCRIPAQLVLSCIGYLGAPVEGVPFDEVRGVVPNTDGRVVRDGRIVSGEYVAGWIKRGPTGVIGTNKQDAKETVAALLQDLRSGARVRRDVGDVRDLLDERGVQVVLWSGWSSIEQAEADLGASLGRGTVKITDTQGLLRAALRQEGR